MSPCQCPRCKSALNFDRRAFNFKRRNPRKPAPAIYLPEPEDIEYLGIFLTPQSKEKLKQAISPKFKQKSGDHLTILYNPDEEDLERFSPYIGKHVVLTATHIVGNDRVQAIRIKDIETERGVPHITISWDDGVSPAESNELVATEIGQPIQPWLKLQGVFDVYPRSVLRNPWYDSVLTEDLYRGITTAGEGSNVGVLGAGVYLTWQKNAAEGFARIAADRHGGEPQVKAYQLAPGLKLLERNTKEWAAFMADLGLEPWDNISDPTFSAVLTSNIKDAGYDGVISTDPYDGLVVFDSSNVIGYADPLQCENCGKRRLRCNDCGHIYCAFGCERDYDDCPECGICKQCGTSDLDQCYECDTKYCYECDEICPEGCD